MAGIIYAGFTLVSKVMPHPHNPPRSLQSEQSVVAPNVIAVLSTSTNAISGFLKISLQYRVAADTSLPGMTNSIR